MILDGDTKMYLLEVEKNTGFSGSRKVNSSRGEYGHDYADTDDSSDDKDHSEEYDDRTSCPIGSCEGCSEEKCFGDCRLVYTGEKGKDKLFYHGPGKGKCVERTCKKKEDCKNYEHSGFDCSSRGYCKSPCNHIHCYKCAETQCKELDWSCDWKENKNRCVNKPECKKDADCLTLAQQEPSRCSLGECVQGDLVCDKDGFCVEVVCDPATMGGCEGCSYNQCYKMEDKKDCVLVEGKSVEEHKCVSKTCTYNKDCRKLFTSLCFYGDCAEGDLFCNKEGFCEQVVCDPATMGGCEGCSINQCYMMEDEKDCVVVKGKSGEEDKCVSNTCTNNKDCRKLFTSLCYYGDCVEGDLFCNKEGFCEQVVCDPATMGGCEGCSANQCKMMEDKKDCVVVKGEDKCVSKTCTNNKDCRKLFTNLCISGDCEEGDVVCNKEGYCERVVCDPDTMGGCEGCSYNQCGAMMDDRKECVVVEGKSKEEHKCVSNTCTNNKDCRKVRDDENYVCKNGTCQWNHKHL